jgi:dihydrodipicolinate synthase/N-acetylneuraminate lyase
MLMDGVFAAVTTPFYPDERVYYRKLEANLARYSRSQLAGVAVLGSTGEATMLDDTESREVLRVAAQATAPEKVLIAGAGRESVKATVELAEAAANFQYDAILVRTPNYFAGQMTTAAVRTYFESVADRSPLPLLVYNIPKFVPYMIPVELIAELAHHPNILGVKDSSGDPERIRALVAATANAPRRTVTVTPEFAAVTARMKNLKTPEQGSFLPVSALAGGETLSNSLPPSAQKTRTKEVGFQVLCGTGSVLFESLVAGACGAVLASADFVPQLCQEIYLAWKDRDTRLAEEKQQRLAAIDRRIIGELGIAGIKYACDYNGYYGGRGRSPLLPLTAEEKFVLECLLAEARN